MFHTRFTILCIKQIYPYHLSTTTYAKSPKKNFTFSIKDLYQKSLDWKWKTFFFYQKSLILDLSQWCSGYKIYALGVWWGIQYLMGTGWVKVCVMCVCVCWVSDGITLNQKKKKASDFYLKELRKRPVIVCNWHEKGGSLMEKSL